MRQAPPCRILLRPGGPPRSGRRGAASLVVALSVLALSGPASGSLAAQVPTQEEPVSEPAAQVTDPAVPVRPDARLVGLEEAAELALRRSPALARAEAELDGARGDRLRAYGALLPTVELGYGYSNSSTGRLDPTGQTITNTAWSTELTARYDVLGFLRRGSNLTAAREQTTAAGARHREERYRAVLDAKAAWFEAVATRQLAEVEANRVRRQEAQLDSVQVQLELGQVARTDILRSEVALNEARLALVRARNAVRTADLALARAIGEEGAVAPSSTEIPDPQPLPVSREEALASGLGAGPAVRSARAEAEAAEAAVRSARSAFMPELSFAGSWAWSATEFPPDRRSWRIFLFGGVPLFNGFQRENQIWQASARADAARADARSAELQLREEVEAAFGQVEAALAAVELSDKTVDLAREELEANQERFRFGRGSILELQEAQIALGRAEAERVRARFDYQVGVATLEYLLGTDL